MKGLLCACLLVSLQLLSPARAYEADIHYSTTYVLARAVGWSDAEALVIASANEGVDANPDTVAALELDTTPRAPFVGYVMSSVRQAEKNLRFHCFSRARGQSGRVADDVRRVMSGHFARVPAHDEDPRRKSERLIALGVALHCQQDAYAHVDFGGSCGSHAGNCLGHTHHNFLDQVVFGLVKKHYYNPDHPGVSGEQLLEVLQGTVSELAARRPRGSARAIPADSLTALSDSLRESGLELPDDVRRECNRFIAGKWLHELFQSGDATHRKPARVEKLAAAVARTCRNPSLASATIVSIPAPRFPHLNADASPHLVRADGSYQLVHERDLGPLPRMAAGANAGFGSTLVTRKLKVQLSHWSQLLALPPLTQE